jgi:hypothetical protein
MEKEERNESDTGLTVDPQREVRERLEAIDDGKEIEALAEKAKVRNLADADEIINYANIKKKLELPSIGYFVEYLPLRIEDRIEVMRITDDNLEVQTDLRNRRTVFLLLNRANPEIWTEETVGKLSAVLVDAILLEYGYEEDDRFLLPIIKRKLDGLAQITQPNV